MSKQWVKANGNWCRLKNGIGWINLNYTIQMSSISTATNNSKYKTRLYKINTDTLNIRKVDGSWGYFTIKK